VNLVDRLEHIDRFAADADRANNLEDIFVALRKQVERLEFERFSYWLIWPPGGPHRPLYVSSYPAEWLDRYIKNKYASEDMVGRFAARLVRPFGWAEILRRRLTKSQRLVMTESAEFGLKAGVSVPLHGPELAKAAFSVANNMPEAEFNKLFLARRHELHLIATYAHARIISFGLDKVPETAVALAPREIEVITWTARGKTRWEISQILSISEETVKDYLENACKKLGATNKTHATALALVHGLIRP
jgi:DNA-binding CsgD family transcriptional regulator